MNSTFEFLPFYSSRSIANKGWEELIVLRASDGGFSCIQDGYDVVGADESPTAVKLQNVWGSVSAVGNYFTRKTKSNPESN